MEIFMRYLLICVLVLCSVACDFLGGGPEEDVTGNQASPQAGGEAGEPDLYRSSSSFAFASIPVEASPVTAEVMIRNDGDGPLELSDFEFSFESPESYTLTYQREGNEDREVGFYTVQGSPRNGIDMGIRLSPSASVVFYLQYTPDDEGPSGSVSFSSNDANHTRVELRVTAPALSVDPSSLSFGSVQLGERSERTLTVSNLGDGLTTIERVELRSSTSELLDFSISLNDVDPTVDTSALQDPDGDGARGLGSMKSFLMTVTYSPSTAEVAQGELVITELGGREHVVALTSNRLTPCLNLSLSNGEPIEGGLDFGFVEPGESGERELVIESCGAESLELLSISVEGDDGFALGEGAPSRYPVRLPPATDEAPSARVIQLLFTPPGRSIYTSTLIIESDDPDQPRLEVPLRGLSEEGLECPVAVVEQPELRVDPYEVITLDASRSTPAVGSGGGLVRYEWSVTQRPEGSTSSLVERFNTSSRPGDGGVLDDPETPQTRLFIDVAGEYVISLIVVNEQGLEAPSVACPQPAAEVHINASPGDGLLVELTWHTPGDVNETDSDGTDLDLHLLHPNATSWANGMSEVDNTYDCYYANTRPDWGAAGPANNPSLDIDDTNGAGPEVISIADPEVIGTGGYRVGVHYYSSGDALYGDDYGPSDATVRLYQSGILAYEMTRRLSAAGQLWDVLEVTWDGSAGQVNAVDQVYTSIP